MVLIFQGDQMKRVEEQMRAKETCRVEADWEYPWNLGMQWQEVGMISSAFRYIGVSSAGRCRTQQQNGYPNPSTSFEGNKKV